jgi:hypothetical protein
MPGRIRMLFTAGVLCVPLARGVGQGQVISVPRVPQRVVNGVPIGEPIQKTDPEYTEEARVAELEGTVVLSGVIGDDGFAHDLEVLRPLGAG